MTVHTLQTGFPELPITPGLKLKLEAIDPTTGAAVTGVSVTNWAIYGYDVSPGDFTDDIPHWVSIDEGSG